MQTPIDSLLRQQAQRGKIRFCMPGHKGMLANNDITEAGAMDNLLHPEGALLQAQSLLAEAYGAAQAWFGTCGSTMGNYALILSCAKPDDLILLASDCHISAVHAALLAHYRISLISCDQTAQGLPQPMSYQKAAEALSSHPEAKALVMTSPNYYGFCADIPAIAALCHEKNVAFLVDAAHGAHFGFSPLLPIQPVDADGWVVSAHKTLCVSNQGSLIFRGKKSKLDAFRLENNVHRFQSTSPSWPLLAQMDKARAQLHEQGAADYQRLHALLADFQASISTLPVRCIQADPQQKDFSRLVLDVSSLGTSGFVLCEQLAEMGIWVEMADARHLVLICTPQDTPQSFSALENALSAFSANGANAPVPPSIPKRSGEIIAPASVEYDTIRTISVSQSVGCISARAVCCYPPGTAVLCPGERITSEQAAYLEGMHRLGASISGNVPAEDSSLSLYVVDFREHA